MLVPPKFLYAPFLVHHFRLPVKKAFVNEIEENKKDTV